MHRIRQRGVELGRDKIVFMVALPPLHRRILWSVILLLLIGQIMLFSATGVLGLERHGSEFWYSIRQAICAAFGLLMMWLVSRVKYQTWSKVAYFLLAAQIC